jgi:hypothetical protein
MPRKTLKQRNAEQAIRQLQVRKTAKQKLKPTRDEIARVVLWLMIKSVTREDRKRREAVDSLRNMAVEALEQQGFSPRECETYFEYLVQKYADGSWPFRPKEHLEGKDVPKS